MIASANHVSIETQTDSNEIPQNNDDIQSIRSVLISNTRIMSMKKKLYNIYFRLRIVCSNNLMLLFIIAAAVIGISLGFVLRQFEFSPESISYFGFPGELYVRALRFVTLPLFFCNLITGMSGLVYRTKKITLLTFAFYCFSLVSSLLIGFLLVLTIKPGLFK